MGKTWLVPQKLAAGPILRVNSLLGFATARFHMVTSQMVTGQASTKQFAILCTLIVCVCMCCPPKGGGGGGGGRPQNCVTLDLSHGLLVLGQACHYAFHAQAGAPA